MPAEMNEVYQHYNEILESQRTDIQQDSENTPEVPASNDSPSQIKMTVINMNDESDLENAIDEVAKSYNVPYDVTTMPISSWNELQRVMTGKTTKFNSNSEETRAEKWFSPSDENLGSSDDISISDSLMSLLLQDQALVDNNVLVESTNDESTNNESTNNEPTNNESSPIDNVKGQETLNKTTTELPVSSAKFDNDLKVAVRDAIKSALPGVMNKLLVDIAGDFMRRHAENEVLKSESVSV